MANCRERETTFAEPMYSVARRTILADPPKLEEWRAALREQSEAAADSVERKIARRLRREE